MAITAFVLNKYSTVVSYILVKNIIVIAKSFIYFLMTIINIFNFLLK